MKERSPFSKWEVESRSRLAAWGKLSAPQLFVMSFLLLVGLGTIGFRTLPGLYTQEPLSWLDSLFTATSAVCVTGLIVEDTATFFTPAGQLYILALIQFGGLGIIAFTSLIIVTLGRRLSLRSEALSTGSFEVAPHVSRRNLIRDVVRFTFAIEGLGAVLLYLLWAPRMGWTAAAWPALFHSVSAFCNAGFSTFSDSLMSFHRSPWTLGVIMMLIILGGIGFLTLEELRLRWRAQRTEQIFRLSLHTKLVLGTTAVLLLGGTLLFALFEWYGVLRADPVKDRIINAMFMSTTARTAGFNTIDYAQASERSLFLTILLMTVGGSPGSTAGGLKTTTVALIGLLAWSRYRGRSYVGLWSRSVPPESVERAVGLFVVSFGLVTIAIFLLTTTELSGWTRMDFLDCMFEAASAFNTVGLSTGLTPELTPGGRWVAILLMFLGRVGPLTFVAALARRQRVSGVAQLRYAYEDVVVG
ncbi:MAG TPA: TrkH family potassium uptake protein [Tepidisphaeraceae bacterium]|nr:TrkH family potassium uptake protein [Tepidisphaeraceae bacterium]